MLTAFVSPTPFCLQHTSSHHTTTSPPTLNSLHRVIPHSVKVSFRSLPYPALDYSICHLLGARNPFIRESRDGGPKATAASRHALLLPV
ncbi:hypothetical protein E2C01_087522 [Portunus trituberculatus]|uniref:Uncharacterized protein n=1 Tax=Portunus trituberculatus TaxID=210409 RepID=A0A5B7JDK7_PORTR|nr:hypothetical protein [Portunus trituberculatus]